jgi:hypothetical protein
MLPRATVCHSTPGRLRIRLDAGRRDDAYLGHVADRLSRCAGIVEARANPLTGSLVIEHRSDASSIARHAAEAGLFVLGPAPRAVRPLSEQVAATLDGAQRRVDRALGGVLDTRGLIFALLVGAALFQAGEGALLGPAATLLWYAVHVLKSGGGSGGGVKPEEGAADAQ